MDNLINMLLSPKKSSFNSIIESFSILSPRQNIIGYIPSIIFVILILGFNVSINPAISYFILLFFSGLLILSSLCIGIMYLTVKDKSFYVLKEILDKKENNYLEKIFCYQINFIFLICFGLLFSFFFSVFIESLLNQYVMAFYLFVLTRIIFEIKSFIYNIINYLNGVMALKINLINIKKEDKDEI